MPDVALDRQRMSDLLGNLAALRDELENADDNAEELADATGHRRLAGVVVDFADGWRVRRGELVEMVHDTHTQGDAIQTGIVEFDENAL